MSSKDVDGNEREGERKEQEKCDHKRLRVEYGNVVANRTTEIYVFIVTTTDGKLIIINCASRRRTYEEEEKREEQTT